MGFTVEYRFLGDSDGKESACSAGDPGSILELGRSPGEGDGNPLQYCLENLTAGEAWRATVHGVAKSRTVYGVVSRTERLTLSLSPGGQGTESCRVGLRFPSKRGWTSRTHTNTNVSFCIHLSPVLAPCKQS